MVLGEGLAVSGKTSAKTSAARLNGMSAASFAVRYRSSGAIGPWRVKSAGTVAGASIRHWHA
jgi:hypothetical protein